ncbi:tyrosine-type recombinase/integrase [Rhodospirillum sp. A1_3_36]|uniref:tyrosine-type recombinase/integrase n=1 Tax=Rhodospirillum sp. A1_3_36 TaxID=3391666 RepID=UPI0039A4910E
MSVLLDRFQAWIPTVPSGVTGASRAIVFRLAPRARGWIVETFGILVRRTGATQAGDLTVETVRIWLDGWAASDPRRSHALATAFLHVVADFLRSEGIKAQALSQLPVPETLRAPIEDRLERFYQETQAFKGNTKDTLRWFRGIFPMFLRDTFVREVPEITRDVVKDWIADGCRDRGWSAKTVRNYLQAINLFLDWCVENGHLPENPAKTISRPRLPKALPKALSQRDAVALLEAAETMPYTGPFEKARAVAIIATFLFTGIRRGELENLKEADVRLDPEGADLIVRRGKGRKDRQIPLPERPRRLLLAYLRERARLGRTTPYFFTGLRHDGRLGVKTVDRLVKRLRGHSGIYFYPHMLRHTCATLLVQEGSSTRGVQELLGHDCEDESEELHRRLADIARAEGFELGDLEDVTLVSRVGEASELLRHDKYGKVQGPSQLYEDVRRAVRESGAQIVIMDSLHDLFDGNENVRTEARTFVGMLRKIALEIDGAVVLCAHPSMSGLNSGSGSAGSTAWNNAVRSRFYLTIPKDDDDEDPDVRLIERKKGNYGARAAKSDGVKIRWECGRFIRLIQGGAVERIEINARMKRAKETFMAALSTLDKQGRSVTDAPNSPGRYAPRVMATMPECRGVSEKSLGKAMEELFNEGKIVMGPSLG